MHASVANTDRTRRKIDTKLSLQIGEEWDVVGGPKYSETGAFISTRFQISVKIEWAEPSTSQIVNMYRFSENRVSPREDESSFSSFFTK